MFFYIFLVSWEILQQTSFARIAEFQDFDDIDRNLVHKGIERV